VDAAVLVARAGAVRRGRRLGPPRVAGRARLETGVQPQPARANERATRGGRRRLQGCPGGRQHQLGIGPDPALERQSPEDLENNQHHQASPHRPHRPRRPLPPGSSTNDGIRVAQRRRRSPLFAASREWTLDLSGQGRHMTAVLIGSPRYISSPACAGRPADSGRLNVQDLGEDRRSDYPQIYADPRTWRVVGSTGRLNHVAKPASCPDTSPQGDVAGSANATASSRGCLDAQGDGTDDPDGHAGY